MPHNGNAGAEYALHRLHYFGTAFEFKSIGMGFFHYAYGTGNSFPGIALIASEGHVYHYQGPLNSLSHRFAVIDHLIQSDRQGGNISGHYVRSRISNENNVHTSLIYQLCHRVIVGREHGNFFISLLHFCQTMRRDFAGIFIMY